MNIGQDISRTDIRHDGLPWGMGHNGVDHCDECVRVEKPCSVCSPVPPTQDFSHNALTSTVTKSATPSDQAYSTKVDWGRPEEVRAYKRERQRLKRRAQKT